MHQQKLQIELIAQAVWHVFAITFVGAPVGLFDGDTDGVVDGEPLGDELGLWKVSVNSKMKTCELNRIVIFYHMACQLEALVPW